MSWIRRLDSGLWAATVYTPKGRITESHELKSIVVKWAGDLEADIRRGEFIDPRGAALSLRQVWEQYASSRRLERASRLRDESHWRCWVEPRWGTVPVGSIVKPDVQTWVNELEEDGVDGWTVLGAAKVLKAAMELAVDAGLIRANPARRVKTPIAPDHVDRVLDGDEERVILQCLDELCPDRRDGWLFVATLLDTGARWSEIAAVTREAVDLRSGLISIGPVLERDGTIRDYPKGARSRSAAGFRDVPVGDVLLPRLKPVVLATPRRGLIYTGPDGEWLRYRNWLRVWDRVLRAAKLDDPQPTPHDCRHTALTNLRGLDQAQRMAISGHRDPRSDMRYVHADANRFDEAREAMRRARGARS